MTTTTSAPTDRRVTQAELARELGVSRQAVGDLVKRQVLVLGDDGRLPLDVALRTVRERIRPAGKAAAAAVPAVADKPAANKPAADAPPADPAAGFYVARAAREASEAGIAALKLRQMQRELIDREAAVQAAFTAFRMLRNSITFMPRNLAGQLVGMTDPRAIQQRIEDQIRTVLDDFQRKTLASMAQRLGSESTPEEGDAA